MYFISSKFKSSLFLALLILTSLISCGDSETPDTTPPVITLNGDSSINLFFNEPYNELGASAIDDRDGSVEVVITGTININVLGSYTVSYFATDDAGNKDIITRVIEVILPVKANNVILFIGDGMGQAHREAARLLSIGEVGQLSMDDMPVRGALKTHSANNNITDSAAAATAMATGVKTNNGVISLDANLNFIPTILEKAKDYNKSVGLVTTTQVTHATPAAFASHVESRKNVLNIAEQMILTNLDILLGGGENEFIPSSDTGCYPENGKRTDRRSLVYEAQSTGYTFVCDTASFELIDSTSIELLLGLFSDEGMTRPYSPTLASMTSKAIEVLSKNPEGFFLMVEGGQIDWASHNNNAENAISDTIAMDEAVDIAKQFYEIKKDTLIIVTADHETGGMIISRSSSGHDNEDGPYNIKGGGLFYVNWSTNGHDPINVPVTAIGPQSDKLIGVNENTIIHDIIFDTFE
jgi:alkaline phosphatase